MSDHKNLHIGSVILDKQAKEGDPCLTCPLMPVLNEQINLQTQYWIAVNEATALERANQAPWQKWASANTVRWHAMISVAHILESAELSAESISVQHDLKIIAAAEGQSGVQQALALAPLHPAQAAIVDTLYKEILQKSAGPKQPWGRWEEEQQSRWNAVMQMVQRFTDPDHIDQAMQVMVGIMRKIISEIGLSAIGDAIQSETFTQPQKTLLLEALEEASGAPIEPHDAFFGWNNHQKNIQWDQIIRQAKSELRASKSSKIAAITNILIALYRSGLSIMELEEAISTVDSDEVQTLLNRILKDIFG